MKKITTPEYRNPKVKFPLNYILSLYNPSPLLKLIHAHR